jgi:hypothetical protein
MAKPLPRVVMSVAVSKQWRNNNSQGTERKKKRAAIEQAQVSGCHERGCVCHLLGLLFPEDGCSMFLQNVGDNLKVNG